MNRLYYHSLHIFFGKKIETEDSIEHNLLLPI